MGKINSELLDQQLAAEAPVAEAGIPVRLPQASPSHDLTAKLR